MKKRIVLFILCIFIGVSIAPSITGNIKQISKNSDLNVDTVLTRSINYDNDNNDPSLLDINTGLVGYWSFDFENAEDESGNNNHGTVYGAVAVEGISGIALDFNGINDYTIVDNDPSLNFHDTNKFTISLWFKSKGNLHPSKNECLISKATSAYNAGYIVYLTASNKTVYFKLFDEYSSIILYSKTSIQENTWHHVVAIWDGTQLYIYLNGLLDNTKYIGDFTVSDDPKPLEFGHHWGYTDGDKPFHGILDEIRIYDRVLNNDEIQELFNNPSGLKTTIFIGEITNLNSDFGNILTFEAKNLRIIQFSPFQVLKYLSDEKIKISEDYLGIITPKFAFGIFKANI